VFLAVTYLLLLSFESSPSFTISTVVVDRVPSFRVSLAAENANFMVFLFVKLSVKVH
jgi:hypothetical protein